MLRSVALGVNGAHDPGLLDGQVMMRGAEAKAAFKADRLTGILVEHLGLALHEHGLQQHLASVLGMHYSTDVTRPVSS